MKLRDFRNWHFATSSPGADNVRCSGRIGSKRRVVKAALLTQLRHWLCTAAMDLMSVSAPIKGPVPCCSPSRRDQAWPDACRDVHAARGHSNHRSQSRGDGTDNRISSGHRSPLRHHCFPVSFLGPDFKSSAICKQTRRPR
jgi:hypothetical protein